MTGERTVAVLAGGISHEREVSLRSGRRLAAALRCVGVGVREWDVDGALIERLRDDPPDAVAIALHGGEGENGSVQAVLELLAVPFVGTPARACRRAWDKPTAKAELARAGLDPTTPTATPPVPRTSTARRASTPRPPPDWPTPPWPRTSSSGCATSPAPTPWWTPPVAPRS
jgi:hypothetical protein